MGRLTATALLAAVLLAALAAPSNAAAASCFGAPADYLARFGSSYPEPRVFLEVQGWLTRAGETPGHHSEHIHSGTCYPQGETWSPSAPMRLDYRHVFHNVVGYAVTDVRGGFVNGGNGLLETAAQKQELTAAAKASADTTVTVFQSYPIGKATSNGRKEFRTGLNLARSSSAALVDRWFTSTGWQSYFAFPGLESSSPVRSCDVLISRNWASGFDYGNNGYGCSWKASTMSAPVPASWTVHADMASGVNRGSIHVDPDFHMHPDNLGVWSKQLSGEQNVTVPAGTLPPGLHRLVYVGHEGGGTKLTSTVVSVIPFLVG